MEKFFGPFSGYLVTVRVAEASESDGNFTASYKICRDSPGDDSKTKTAIRKRVAGFSSTIDEAFAIGLQLARLHVAGLPDGVACASAPETRSTATLAEFARSWGEDRQRDSRPMTYEATMACPLEPMASRQA